MPKATKRAPKARIEATIPEPFEAAPATLAPLLETFDHDTVYITHIDKHPASFKRRIFFVPVGLNTVLAALLLWRAYAAYPVYCNILLSFFGKPNETTIYYATTPWGKLIKQVVWRMAVFLFDWLLFTIVGPWPWSFFFESGGNPLMWRINVGFRDEEVYVRQSRGWGAKDLLGEAEGSSGKAGGDSPFFKTRILPAVDMTRLREKTGYLLMDGNFDLDFGSMIVATQLIDKKMISAKDFGTSVFVWAGSDTKGQWAVWNCGRLDDGAETEARHKIMLFKDRLTALGKESLFFKWVELVQFESSAPEGFTMERQTVTAEKAKKLFEDEGIDFDTFIRGIGGLGGLPGMD
ncbi:hypothetical protein K458DRAFT_296066 [Lentithecium fluviatile CBS 122367]|uniref:Uncharacterized protein n=1 Tax=Lentithecium fluviatile CBS 122367 TaxID=1168545 RepID=A0A6G1JAL2_9PLEO|nr:hypothetical protein K458DRAFT_296066 [Lentithecium fluviatile CBS 122367]